MFCINESCFCNSCRCHSINSVWKRVNKNLNNICNMKLFKKFFKKGIYDTSFFAWLSFVCNPSVKGCLSYSYKLGKATTIFTNKGLGEIEEQFLQHFKVSVLFQSNGSKLLRILILNRLGVSFFIKITYAEFYKKIPYNFNPAFPS